MDAMKIIPDEVLDRFVSGVNLMPGSLRDQLGSDATVLVFLRHFGCTFCRETIADLRAASESVSDFPPVLFFFQGSPREGRAFLRHYWRDARAVADEPLAFYEAFDVSRGSFMQMMGPGVIRSKRRANRKGHFNGERNGDLWRMPGLLIVRENQVLWRHDFQHAADHPDFERLPAILGELGEAHG